MRARYVNLFAASAIYDVVCTACSYSVSQRWVIAAAATAFIMPWFGMVSFWSFVDAKTPRDRLAVTLCTATAYALATAATLLILQ